MTHTDEDILDLFTCLQGVGAAETPYEEADRLRIEAKEDHKQSQETQMDMTKWLLDKSYPHTYALTLRLNTLTRRITTTLFPIFKGHVILSDKVLTREECEVIFFPLVYSFYYYQDLQGLKQGLIDLKAEHPDISLDKYPFLDIV